jgi:hypothetical protein
MGIFQDFTDAAFYKTYEQNVCICWKASDLLIADFTICLSFQAC